MIFFSGSIGLMVLSRFWLLQVAQPELLQSLNDILFKSGGNYLSAVRASTRRKVFA